MPNINLVENKLSKTTNLVKNSLRSTNKIYQILFVLSSLFILFLSSTSTAYASDRYWIGGTGNWSDTSHWSDTDGGAGGFSVPTSSDNVFFSAGSFSVDGNVVTLNTVANTANLDFVGIDQAVTFSSSVNSINIYGGLNLPATNLTWTFTGTAYTYLRATTSVNITMGATTDKVFNRLYFDGVGGTWTLQDEMNIVANTYLTNGTFNINNQTFTTSGLFDTALGTKTLTLGNGSLICERFRNNSPTNFTFNYNTGTVWLKAKDINAELSGINTFYNLKLESVSGFGVITVNANQTVNNELTFIGLNAQSNRLLIDSSAVDTTRTITVNPANVVASNVDFRDIRFANPIDLSAISGGSGDGGGNSGITFTPAVPQYFKHTSGAVNWSDSSKWFSDQAKTIPGRVPLPQDDAIFDEDSFTDTSTLTLDVPRVGKNMDMSTINQAVTFKMVNDIEVFGDFILNNSITLSGMFTVSLYGRDENFSISTFSKTIYAIKIFGNQYTLLSDLYTVNAFVMKGSTLSWVDLNDFDVSCDNNYSTNVAGTAYMGNGTFTIRSTGSGIKFSASTNFFAENSTIKFNVLSGTNNISFYGDGKTYNKLWLAGTHSGTYGINGNNTFNELIIDPGRNVRFTAGTTQYINKLTANGTIDDPIIITSATGATHTLNYTGATNAVGDYLNISYSNATPANKWYASNSTDAGNNTGWIFANIPDMPTNLSPTAGNTQMSLSWTIPVSDGGDAITDYVVEYKLATDSIWSIFADAISTLTTTTVIGLTNGRSYDFRVYAVNNVGQGMASAIASATPFSPNDRYWVGGTGNWSDTAHWANTDGGVGGQSVPTSTNDVYFSAGSFSVNGNVVTIDATANMEDLNMSGADQTFNLTNTANSFIIYGSLYDSIKRINGFSSTGYLYFKATTSKTITSNGAAASWNRINFNGTNGEWINQDDWNVGNSYIYLIGGTWNTNSKIINANHFFTANTSATGLILGNSNLNFTGNFNFYQGNNNLTVDPGTSTITASIINAANFTFYNLKCNILNLNPNGGTKAGNLTVNNLEISPTSSQSSGINIYNYGIIVNNNLTLSGYNNTNYRQLIYSNTIGTQRTITVDPAKVTASNVDFRDIRFANPIDLSAIPGLSGDAGGNSGITFTTAQPQWFKHTSGAVNWSDSSKWFSDQAMTIPGRVPLPQDDATFDAGSFTGASTLTVNVPRIGRSLDMSTVNQTVTMTLTNAVESYGSLVLGSNITTNGSYTLILMGRSNFILNLFSKLYYSINLSAPGGTYTNMNGFSLGYGLIGTAGTFDFNDFNTSMRFIQPSNLTLYLGNGTLTFTTTLSESINTSTPLALYAEGSTIKLNPASGSSNITFSGRNMNFNKVWFSGSHTGNFDITGNNTINELIIDPGRNVRFTAGTTQQIGKLTANGTVDNPITIGSVTGATHTLNYTGVDPVVVNYANISYSNATPANTWFASNSVDGGNNTGWIFADEPDAPTAVGASVGDSLVSLSWSPPAFNGGTAITDYAIEYKLTSEPTVWSLFADGVNTNTTGIVTGLTNGLSYDFKVRAINLIGQGIESSIVTATPLTIPSAPTDIIATRLNASASIAFNPPISDGGSPITSYTVTSNPESKTEIGNTSPIIITGLTNGTPYTFTVTATNIAGAGPASSSSNSVIPATVPDAPTAPTGIAGNGEVELSWIDPVWNGGSDIIDYVIEYKLSSEPTVWSSFADGISNNTTSTITSLTNAESYDFRIYAVNDVGQGSVSTETSATPITVPDAPTSVTGIAGNAEATISFTPPIFNGGSTINSYKVTSNPGNFTATGNASPISITGLTNGTPYTFTVTATNAVGEGVSSIPSDPITPVTIPDAPTAVTAVEGNGQATVSFTAPIFDGGTPIISYTVTSSPGNFTATGTFSPITVTGLTNGTTYTFTVKATNIVGSGGESSPSNQVTLSTEPLPPINLASTVLGSSIGLSWSTPTSDGGSSIIDYVIEYQLSAGGEWAIFADGINTNTTAIVNGLANRSSYDFRVSARNIIGQSSPSSVVSATPGEPAQVLVQSFSNLNLPNIATSIRITNEGELDYEYQYNWCITDSSSNLCGGGNDIFDSTAAKLIDSGDNWDTDLISTILTPGDYYFHIKVLYGSESSNAYQSFTALATYPDTPTNPVATASDKQASISFDPSVFSGGSPILNYTVTSTPGGLIGTGNSSPIIVTGLTNGNSYTFNVTATNIIGTSSASVSSNSVTPLSTPDAPTSLSAIAGDTKVDLSWIAPIDNGGSNITDYIIEYKLASDFVWSVFSDGISTNTNTTVTGLVNNQSYDFRVSAVNIVGQSSVNTTNINLPIINNRRKISGSYLPPKVPPTTEVVKIENIERPINQNIPTVTKKDNNKKTNIEEGDERDLIQTENKKEDEDMDKNDNQIRVTPTNKIDDSPTEVKTKTEKIKTIAIYGSIFIGTIVLLYIIFRIIISSRKNRQ